MEIFYQARVMKNLLFFAILYSIIILLYIYHKCELFRNFLIILPPVFILDSYYNDFDYIDNMLKTFNFL
jgi:hypothetical protein